MTSGKGRLVFGYEGSTMEFFVRYLGGWAHFDNESGTVME